ncbi:hypothetical protein ZWY2020_033908 [Hordeum vulgare]|nr:hypothetical protein ZWY2020_033908 [Hordeum vulgare]
MPISSSLSARLAPVPRPCRARMVGPLRLPQAEADTAATHILTTWSRSRQRPSLQRPPRNALATSSSGPCEPERHARVGSACAKPSRRRRR